MAPPLVSSLLPESSPRHEAEEAAAAREVTGSEVCGFAAGSEASCPVYGAHCGAPSPGEGEEVNRLAALIRSVESGRPSACRRAVRGLAAKLRLYEATRRGCRCTRAPTTGASKGPFSRASVSPERRDFEGESDAQGGARREAQGAGERGDVCPATGASCENDADAANAALHRHAGRVRAGDAGGSGEGPRGDRQPPPRRDAVSGCDSPVCASRTWLHHALAAALARLVQRGVETNGLAATAATAEVARDDEVALGAREEEENQDALLQGLQLVKALCEMDSQYLPAFHGLGMVAHLNRLLSRLLEASRRSQASRVNDVETLCSPPLFRTPHPALAPTVTEVLQTLLTLSPARESPRWRGWESQSPARALVSPSLLLCTAPSGAIGANRMWAQGAANVQAYPTPTGGCAGASGAGGASSAVSDASAFAEAPRLAAAAFPASRAPAHRDSHPPLPSDGAPPPAASQGPSPCALPSTGSSAAPSRAGLAEARGLGARAEWGAARPDEFLAGNGSRSAERGGDAGTAGQVSLCVAARPAPRSVVPAIVHDPRILACRPEDSRRTSGSSTPRGETRDSSPRAPRRALRALSSPSAAATPSSAASSCPVSPLFLKVPDSSFTLCAVPAPASPATYGERGDRALEQEGGALPASESRGYLRLEQPSAGVSPRTSALPASAEPSASPLSPRRARAASPAAARGAVLGAEGGLGRRGEATAGLDAAADSLRKPRGVGGRRACDERGERGRAARDWRGSQTRCAGEEASETRGVHASDVELLQSLCEAFSAPSLPSADAIRLATCLPVDVLPDLHPVARLAVSRSLWRQHERLAASPWSPSSFSSSPASSLFSFRALAPSQLKRRKQALALAPPACLLQALGQALANAGDALEETGGGGVGFASVSLFRQASGEGPQTSWLHLGSVRRRNGHEKECIPSLLRAANATLENLREVLSVASCASPRGGGLPLAGQPAVPFSAASVSPRTSASSPLRCGCCADFPCRALLASLVTRAFASALTEPEALPQIRRLLALCLQVHRLFLKRLPAEEPRPSSRLAAGDAAPAEASESPAEERPSLFAAEEAAHVGALLRRAAERYFPQERDRFAPVAEAATATTVSRRKIAGEMKLLLERVPAVGGSGEGPEDPTRVARGRTETFGDSGDEEGTLQVSTASALTPEQDTFLDIFWLALASIPAPLRLTWLAESRLLPHLLFFLLRSNVLFARSRLVPLLLQPLFTACCARSARLDAESRGDGLREAFPSSPASAAEALCAAGCQAPAGDTKCAFSSGKAFFHASLMIDALLALWLQLGGGGPPAWTCAPQLARAEAPRREEDSQQPDGGRPAHAETLDKAFIGGRLPQESVDAPRASFSEAFAEAVVACFQARHQSFENVRALLPFISSCTFTSWRDSENASGGQRAARVPSPERAPAACGASPPPGVSQDTAPAAAGAALFPLYLFLLGNPRGPRRPQSPHADASGFGAEEEEEEDAEGRRDAADAHERLRVLLHALVNAVFHSALQALARLRGTCAAPALPVSVSLLALLALLTCPNSRVAAVFFSRVSEMLLDFPPFSPSGARRLSPLANATSPAADGPSPRPSSPAAPSFVSSPSAFAPALASLLLSPDFIYELCVSGPPAARAFLKSRVVPFLLRVGGFFGSHDDISTRSAFCSEALCALDFVDLWDPVLLPPLLALPEDACVSSPSSSRPPRWPGSAEGGASVAVLARFSAAQLLRRLFSVQAAVRRDAGEALRLQAQGLASAAAALAASSPFFAFSPSCSPPARRAAAALAGAAAARERGRGGEAERKGRQRNGPRDARAPRAASRGEVGEPANPLGTAAAHWRTQGREEMQRLVVRDLVWRQAEIDVLVRALANPKLDAQTKLQSLQALSVYLASCPSEGARFLASPDFFTGVGAGETSGAAASAAAARDASPGPNERDGARLAGTLQGLRGASSLATTRAALRRLSLGSRAPDAAGAQATSVISSVQLLPSLLSMFFALCVEAVSAVGGTSSIVLELLAEALRLFGVFLLVLPTRGRVSLQLHAHLESELVASGILGALALSPAAAASAAVCFHSMQLAGLLLFSPFHTFLFASRLSPLEPGLAPLLAEPPASRLRGAAAPLEPRPATPGEARVSSWAFPGASARLAARAPPARAATAQGEGRALRLLVPCWVTKTYLFPLPLKQVQLRSASLCFWDARPQNVAFELAADAWAHVGSLLASGALAPVPHVSRELPEETHGRGEIQGGGESRERVDDACDAAAWGVVRAGDGSSGRDGSKDVCSPRRQSRREAFPIFFVDLVAQALAGCAPREGDRETPGGCADERDDGMSPADSALAPWAMPALLMSLAETQGLALSRSRQVALAREAPFLSLRLPDSVRELSALAEGDGGDSFVSAASAAAAGALPSGSSWRATPLPVVGLARSNLLLTPRVAQLLLEPDSRYFSLLLQLVRQPPPLRTARSLLRGLSAEEAERSDDDGFARVWRNEAEEEIAGVSHPADVPFLEAVKAADLLLRVLSEEALAAGGATCCKGDRARRLALERGGKGTSTERDAARRRLKSERLANWSTGSAPWDGENLPPSLRLALASLADAAAQRILPFVADQASQLAEVLEEKDRRAAALASPLADRERTDRDARLNGASESPLPGDGNLQGEACAPASQPPSWSSPETCRRASAASCVRELDLLLACIEFLLRLLPLVMRQSVQWCDVGLLPAAADGHLSGPLGSCFCCCVRTVDVPRLFADLFRISGDLSTLRRRAFDLAECLLLPLKARQPSEILGSAHATQRARKRQAETRGRAARDAREDSGDSGLGGQWEPQSREYLERELLFHLQTAETSERASDLEETLAGAPLSASPSARFSASLRVVSLQGKRPVSQALRLATAVILPLPRGEGRPGALLASRRAALSAWAHAASYWMADSAPEVREAAWRLLADLCSFTSLAQDEDEAPSATSILASKGASPRSESLATSQASSARLASLPPDAWQSLLVASAEAVQRVVGECPQDPAANPPRVPSGATVFVEPEETAGLEPKAVAGAADEACTRGTALPAGFCALCPESLAESVAAALFLSTAVELLGSYFEFEKQHAARTSVSAETFSTTGKHRSFTEEDGAGGRHALGLIHPPAVTESDQEMRGRGEREPLEPEEEADVVALEACLNAVHSWLCSPRFLCGVLPLFLPLDGGISYALSPSPRALFPRPAEAKLAGIRLFRLALSLSPAPVVSLLAREPTDPRLWLRSPSTDAFTRGEGSRPAASLEGAAGLERRRWGLWEALVAAVRPDPGDMSDQEAAEGAPRTAGSGSLKGHEACAAGSRSVAAGLEALESILEAGAKDRDSFQLICAESPLLLHARMLVEGVLRRGFSILTDHGNGACCCVAVERHERARRNGISCGATGRHRARPSAGGRPASSAYPLSRILHASAPGRCMLAARRARETTELLAQVGFLVELLLRLFRLLHPQALDSLPPAAAAVFERRCADRVPVPRPAVPLEPWAVGGRQGPVSRREAAGVAQEVAWRELWSADALWLFILYCIQDGSSQKPGTSGGRGGAPPPCRSASPVHAASPRMPAEASVCPPSSSSPSASSAAATVRLPGLACLLPLSTLSNVTALVSALFVLSQLSATRFLFTVSSSAGLPSSPPQPTSQTCLALFYRLSILLLRRLSTDCLASICAQAVLPSPSTPPGFSASGSRRASSATVQAAESRRRCVSSSSRRVANTSSAPSSAYRWPPFESAIASARVARTASSFFHKMKPDVSPSALREPSRIFGDSAHRGASPSPPQPHRFATRGSLSGMPNPRASQTASTSPAVGSVRRRSTSTTRRGFEAATAPEPHCVESGGSAAEAFPTPRRRLFDFNVACLAWQHMEDLLFETLSLLCVLSPHTAFAVSWRLALPVFFPRARARRGGDAGLLAVFHARAASADGGARAGDVEPDEDAAAELLPAQLLEELEVLSHGSTARAVLSYAASVRVLSSAQKKQAAGQRERSQGGDLLGDFPARVALLDASASRVLSSPSDRLRLSADGEGEAAAALRPRGGLSPPSPERGLGPSGSRGEHGAETDAAGRLTRRHLTTTASCGELVYRRMTQILLLLSRLCTAGGRDPREQGLAEALSERGGAPYGVALGAVKAVWRLAGVQEHLLFLVLGFLQQCFVAAAAPRGSEALSARLLRLANTSGNVSFSSPLSSLCNLRARLLESGILDALINAALEALEKKDVLFLSSSPASSSSSSASSTAVLGSAAKAGDRGTASPLSPRGLFRLLAVVAAGLNAKHEKRADVLRVAAQLGAHVRALLSEFATRSLPASLKRQTSSPPPFALAEEGARDKPPFSPFVGSGARPSHALQVRLVGCLRCLQAVCATAGVAGDRRSLACLFAASPHFAACGGGGDSPPHEIAGAHASRVLLPALRQTTERRMRELYSPRLEFIIKGQHSTQSEIRVSMEIFLQALLIPSLPLASVAALLEFLASTVGCAAGSALSPSLAASAVLYKSSRLLLLSSPSFRAVPAFLLSRRLRPSLLEGVPADAAEASAGADEVRLASRLDGGDADQAFEEDADAFGGEQEATAGRDACAWRRAFRALLELMLTTFCADPRMGDARKLAKPTVCEALRLWHAKLAQTPQASGAETETPHEVYGDEALRELVWSVLQSLA